MPLFENMNMKSNSKVKKKLLIAAVAVLAIVVAVILVCAAYLHAGRSSLRGQRSRDAEMLYEGHSYMYDEDNINILCIGVDARGEADTVGQGDALILVTLNVRDKTIRCLNIRYSGTCQGIWCCGQIYHDPESSGSTGIFIWQ